MLQQGIYDTFYLFSTTERYSKSFNCFPKECVIDGFDLKFIKELIKAQKKRIDKYTKDSPKVASILFVFDDLLEKNLSLKQWRQNRLLVRYGVRCRAVQRFINTLGDLVKLLFADF